MTKYRILKTAAALFFAICFIASVFSTGQDVVDPSSVAGTSDSAPLQIRLSVNEVRLDVVVLDNKGNQITDLSADDFEVYQDGKLQKLLASVYVNSQPDADARPAVAREYASGFQSGTSAALKEEDVRRTILFVVDDFAMTFENGYYTKMALRNFVEKQMRPGDLVAILRTDYGNRALNMFQSEKREVLARINAMPSTMAPRNFESWNVTATKLMEENFRERDVDNQVSAISNGLHVMKNMPGRKILIMLNPLLLPSAHAYGVLDLFQPSFNYDWFRMEYINRQRREEYSMRKRTDDAMLKLADEAMRAGVVVNLLDIDGLYNPNIDASQGSMTAMEWMQFGAKYASPDTVNDIIRLKLDTVLPDPMHEWNPLPDQTGGFNIRNGNFFLDGVGKEVESLMKGYYLISYEPPPNTFESRGKKDEFHRIKVNVKRKDAEVHTRSGFFGNLESESAVVVPKNPLLAAIHSPFQSTDLNVNIAAGYVKDAEAGYVVRSWIHLDPGDLKIVETEDGSARISLETLCVTSDIHGNIQDSKAAQFTLSITPENKSESLAWIWRHGVRFSMLLPVRKPGAYYVHISIQDAATGQVGSAYQFLEIPEVGKKGLSLSNIFMITSGDDLQWMSSDIKKDIAGGVFFPEFRGEARSPALRTYAMGDQLYLLGMLYNADAKSISRSEIEMSSVLYRDGVEFRRGDSVAVTAASEKDDANGIPILQKMSIGTDMPPGDYLVQLLVTDKKNVKKQEGNAAQAIGFTVVEK